MGRHATLGNRLTGHKNTTLKQGSKYYTNQRIRNAGDLASDVLVETFEPLPALPYVRSNPFKGVNPIAGQDFTQVGTNAYKLRVREGFIGLTRKTYKPKDGKAFGIWFASYAGKSVPLLSNRGQALNFKEAKDKLFQLLVCDLTVKPTLVYAADKKVKTPKAYTGGDITRFVIYAIGPKGRIRYTVPENKTCGEIVDDMREKGYTIDRIANS